MIHEQTVYKCKCDKCGHGWVTKTYAVPDRCAKCNRVTWNEDSDPAALPEPTPELVEFSAFQADDARQAKLDELREMINNPQPEPDEPEPVEDVWKFVPSVQHFGETDQYYRGQVCGKRRRTVEVDGSDYERVLRVV